MILNNNTHNDNCEIDCSYYCTGCDRKFCDIKTEEELKHDDELPESCCTVEGNHYCHYDCFRDSH